MARRAPEGPPPPPVVQRVRLRYAKRGRLRFTSHRDFARAFERALRRAEIPMAYSAGFTPHPKISYVGATPTGVASEAEYLEIGLATELDLQVLRAGLNRAMPDGLDILEAVLAGPGSLAERMQASTWRIELDLGVDAVQDALTAFLAAGVVTVERLTKDGRRMIDARGAVLSATASRGVGSLESSQRAILDLVVRQATPAVRPDDVIAALRSVAGLASDAPRWEYRAMRLAQGPLDGSGSVRDPLEPDRTAQQTPS
ncbi:MAG: TIGR03936 family radical SAM-associated protein [Actinomycetota bacterium]